MDVRRKNDYTMVEFVIAGTILGILAMIVSPGFTHAKTDGRQEALISRLQTVRSQMELYKVQHRNEYPNVNTDHAGFVARLTTGTNEDHNPGSNFGPYVYEFPKNPFNSSDTVRFGDDPGMNQAGWCVDSRGRFFADDSGNTLHGIAHKEL